MTAAYGQLTTLRRPAADHSALTPPTPPDGRPAATPESTPADRRPAGYIGQRRATRSTR